LAEGDTVALIGELGAGKTALVQGIAKGIEANAAVTSPTFVLIHEYRGRLPLIHMDLYRLRSVHEAEGLGIQEYFDGTSAIVVEWGDRFPVLLPGDRLQVHMAHRRPTARTAELSASGVKSGALLHRIAADLRRNGSVNRPHAARRGKARPR
jgi:tRNA threonylcarbamoyladenosine biosynthesis protein TsaE